MSDEWEVPPVPEITFLDKPLPDFDFHDFSPSEFSRAFAWLAEVESVVYNGHSGL